VHFVLGNLMQHLLLDLQVLLGRHRLSTHALLIAVLTLGVGLVFAERPCHLARFLKSILRTADIFRDKKVAYLDAFLFEHADAVAQELEVFLSELASYLSGELFLWREESSLSSLRSHLQTFGKVINYGIAFSARALLRIKTVQYISIA
jgi:hypothetical protein